MLHIIHFISGVTIPAVHQLQSCCIGAIQQGASEINIHVSSPGGDFMAGLTAYNYLKSIPITIRTHNIGSVDSVANIIFLAGSERYSNQVSRFFLHPLNLIFSGQSVDHGRLKEYTKCLDNDLERFIEILNIEVSEQHDWSLLIDKSTILNAEQATEYGLIHSIKQAKIVSGCTNWWVTT